MRYLQAIAFLCFSMFLVLACTEGQDDCKRNPYLDCVGANGGGGAATTGGGGSGGMPDCMVATDCGEFPTCKLRTCIAGQCGTADLDDGTKCGANDALECKGGMCTGCKGKEDCDPPTSCHTVECTNTKCVEAPVGTLTCGPDGKGSCSESGECGLCDDGKKNGDESGVDCGAETTCGKCPGETCGGSSECKSGFCADGVCCDAACGGKCEACTMALTGMADGTCGPLTVGTEDPGNAECRGKGGCGAVAGWCACEDGQKNGTETDIDCGGACGGTCTTGQACIDSGNCKNSNSCLDGVCCGSINGTICDGACASCNQVTLQGLCSPLAGDDPGLCSGAQQCNAESLCGAANGQPCAGSNVCASGLCKSNVCTGCGAGNNCGGGKPCLGGICVSKDLANGEPCIDDVMCQNGHCVDGVCCESACNGTCMACHVNYTSKNSGICAPMLADYDPQSECPPAGQPGVGKAATCGGQPADGSGNSGCGSN